MDHICTENLMLHTPSLVTRQTNNANMAQTPQTSCSVTVTVTVIANLS